MWRKVKDNFDSGVERVKWFSSLVSDRLKIEIALMKLLYRSSEMEKKRAALLTAVGERLYGMRNGPDKNVLRDPDVLRTLKQIEDLDAEMEDLRKKASEISRLET
ncbi:MAG TPA: hypothetical protein VMH06_00340 [Thermodesulfovibrionales bacterium]|nr:hypothetical protein [Thermodesulfovibrionales bacterium]